MYNLVMHYFDPAEKLVRTAAVHEPLDIDGFPCTIEHFGRQYKKDMSIFFFWDHLVAAIEGEKKTVGFSCYPIDLPDLTHSPLFKQASNVESFCEFPFDIRLNPAENRESDGAQEFGVAGYVNQGDYLVVLEDSHHLPYAFELTDR